MWMNTEFTDDHKKYIQEIKEFCNIFRKRKVLLLYLSVEKYSKGTLKPLKNLADGLRHGIDAVENAVVYKYSNGFVEEANSRLEMIKSTMYGPCSKRFLEAELRYMG